MCIIYILDIKQGSSCQPAATTRPLRQYLHFCTSKASKLRTSAPREAWKSAISVPPKDRNSPQVYTCIYIYIALLSIYRYLACRQQAATVKAATVRRYTPVYIYLALLSIYRYLACRQQAATVKADRQTDR